MQEYVMGIDIGTSACKAAIFDREGNVKAAKSQEYPVYYPMPGQAEQNPEDWWWAACSTIKEMLSETGISPSAVRGIGVDGQSWAAVAVDKRGKVLCRTPIWMDTRAGDICKRLCRKLEKEAIFRLSGNSLQPSYTTAKILWYRENSPDIYKKIDKILQSNSYIVYRLTGIVTQDKSQGYGMHCFDKKTESWDREMCRLLEIPEGFLPPVYDCAEVVGRISAKASAECGLSAGTPVVAGGLDAACGALGAGVIHAGETQEQGGQAGGMSICMDRPLADERLILSSHVVPGLWLLQGGTSGGGGVMRWFEREFGDFEREEAERTGTSSLMLLNEIAEKTVPGSDALVFLPYMSGERSPIWDACAKGVYYGLDFRKTKGHMVRAAMEGVAFSLRHNLETAQAAGAKADILRAMGGAANSLLWTQIKADVTQKTVIVPDTDHATTLGAALLAGIGTGVYESFEEAVKLTVQIKRRHEPNRGNKEVYDRNYQIYRELYENLKGLMKKQEV